MQLAVPVAAKLAATPGVAVGSLKCGCKEQTPMHASDDLSEVTHMHPIASDATITALSLDDMHPMARGTEIATLCLDANNDCMEPILLSLLSTFGRGADPRLQSSFGHEDLQFRSLDKVASGILSNSKLGQTTDLELAQEHSTGHAVSGLRSIDLGREDITYDCDSATKKTQQADGRMVPQLFEDTHRHWLEQPTGRLVHL